MLDLDIRYAFILFPLVYVLLPFFLTKNFILLGGVTVITFITGVIVFVVITNLHIAGSGDVLATGVSGSFGLNNEAGYSLFVICLGGLFYLGAQLTTIFTPILNIFVGIINTILNFVSTVFGISTSGLQTNVFSSMTITNLGNVYPYSITIQGISVFGALSVVMGSIFMLGLYFMVASRGH
jgi:hypothetical protein